MSRTRNPVPIPRQHKGRAVLDVWKHGHRRQVVLGKWKSKEADAEYRRILAEYATGTFDKPSADATMNELMVAFLAHAEEHYRRPDGTQTSEVDDYKRVIRIVREMYGPELAREFGPRKLTAVRAAMIERGWCRTRVNKLVGRVRRMFKWAVAEEMVPAVVLQGLAAVTGLQQGRTTAREEEPIGPVADEDVEGTLPFLSRYVRGLVEFQRHTGCRPGEACLLRWADVEQVGPVWQYRPAHHKLAHKGKSRVIAVGPRAQEGLAAFPTDDPDAFVFSPRRCVEESRAARAAARQTPLYPSHAKRNTAKRKPQPKRVGGDWYDVKAYGHAIRTAVAKANAAGVKVRPWAPNQLRHSFATRVRQEHGLEAAQVVLGHARADVTQIYAERDRGLAVEVAASLG
jgi:integrase